MARPMSINLIESSYCDFQVNKLHFLLPADKKKEGPREIGGLDLPSSLMFYNERKLCCRKGRLCI